MNKRVEYSLSACFALCAAFLTIAAVHREFFTTDVRVNPPAAEAHYDPEWRTWYDRGHVTGNPNAKLSVLEFADMQCPYCATFHRELDSVAKAYPTDVQIAFVHFPLKSHRFARLAAISAECAGDQVPFLVMIDHMYAQQDSLGVKAWTTLAAEAGVRDTTTFAKCIASGTHVDRVDAGVALGRKLGLRGTPTVYINGWRVARPPTVEEFERLVVEARSGRELSIPGREAGK